MDQLAVATTPPRPPPPLDGQKPPKKRRRVRRKPLTPSPRCTTTSEQSPNGHTHPATPSRFLNVSPPSPCPTSFAAIDDVRRELACGDYTVRQKNTLVLELLRLTNGDEPDTASDAEKAAWKLRRDLMEGIKGAVGFYKDKPTFRNQKANFLRANFKVGDVRVKLHGPEFELSMPLEDPAVLAFALGMALLDCCGEEQIRRADELSARYTSEDIASLFGGLPSLSYPRWGLKMVVGGDVLFNFERERGGITVKGGFKVVKG